MSATDANVNFRSVSTATDRPQVINAGVVKAGLLSGNQAVFGGLVEKTFVGYTPSGWVGAASSSGVYLNVAPSQAATNSTAVNLILPVGSMVRGTQLVRGGSAIVGPSTLDVAVINATSTAGISTALLTAASVAQCNTGPGVVGFVSLAAGINQVDAGDRVSVFPPGGATTVTTGSEAIVYLSVLVPNA